MRSRPWIGGIVELPDGRSRSRSLSRDDFNSHASGPIEIAALGGGLCADCSETIAISTVPGAVLLDQTLLRSASGSLVADEQPKDHHSTDEEDRH